MMELDLRSVGLPVRLQGFHCGGSMVLAAFEVGAYDWQQPQWQEDYYPEEMPAEWRLTYYANEFRCALVPATQWRDEANDWSDEVNEQFRFYFELVEPDDIQRLSTLQPAMAGTLAGAVILQARDDLVRQGARLDLPLYSVATPTDKVKPVWQMESDIQGSTLGWVPAEQIPAHARPLRELVEAFIRQAPVGEQASLIFDRGVRIQTLRDAMVIASLLAPA